MNNLVRGLLAMTLLATSQCAHGPRITSDALIVRGVPLASNVHCASADCRSYNVDPAIRARTAVSVQCMGNTPPGTTPNPKPPPLSYLVSDIGKHGVPQLNAPERAMIERIRRYVRSKTLRFAWVEDSTTMGEPIVFDAYDGPCEGWAAGYAVLNGACNEYYEPGENPYSTHAVPGCYRSSPRPWMDGH